jgi:hypothetical protein
MKLTLEKETHRNLQQSPDWWVGQCTHFADNTSGLIGSAPAREYAGAVKG